MMFNIIDQVFTAIFGRTGKDFVNALARGADDVYDFVYVRVLGLPFIVLGARQTGKTTLIEWLRQNVASMDDFSPAPTPPGGDAVGSFTSFIGDESLRLKPTRDVGGEYEMWETDWVELFREARPRGIIFMIDHTDLLKQKDAFNFLMNLIEEEKESQRGLRAVLVLVNKSDLWLKTTSLDKLMNGYSNEVKRLHNQAERLGYKAMIQSSSVATGVGVRDAMSVFFNAIRPNAR
ncbi:MAG: ADP-ribosylation factor-like protein [Chloroflexota bacterium]|nr:ADP-ribosylation factor-like protein [Chloroflexota bacterium]